MIELRGIVKKYVLGEETVLALAGVDLFIGRTEYFALIGPSGGDVPAGYEVFRMPTDTAWMLGRLLADGKAVVKHPRRTGKPLLRKLPFTSFTSANESRTRGVAT